MEDSPIIQKLFREREKLFDKIRELERQLENRQQTVYLLRERNFQLRKKLSSIRKEKAGN